MTYVDPVDPDALKRNLDIAMLKLGRRAKLQRSIDTPIRKRTALDAAHVALARCIEDGHFV